jgi:CRISPR-associated endonuclease/helicase Cas3
LEILAKDNGQTLAQHVEECLKVANIIIPTLPLSAEEKAALLRDVTIGLAFHDAGKAAIGFQKVMRAEEPNWGGKRHEILSASLASSVPEVREATIFAILTHHKSIPNSGFDEEERRALEFDSLPIDEESENLLHWRRMKSEWSVNYQSFSESWAKICGLIGRADLIGAKSLPRIRLDRSWLKRGMGPNCQLKIETYRDRRYFSLVRGLLMTSDHMASGGHFPSKEQLFEVKNAGSIINQNVRGAFHAFQLQMSETAGNVILRAPTGSGKTEAALMWADHNKTEHSRLYYVLPNIASINAMFQRLRDIYGQDCVGLLHSRARNAIYRDLASGEDLESKIRDQRRAKMLGDLAKSIWFPIRVCTPHQILRYSLRGRGWETMLAEFPTALFVFDEIHAYDPRLVGQIIATAKLVSKWKGKCAFLSATMPSFLKDLITRSLTEHRLTTPKIIFPDMVKDQGIIEKKRHCLHFDKGTLLDHILDIIHDMEFGQRVLVVCNTISSSQKVFARLRDSHAKNGSSDKSTDLIMLIHSKFTRQDRTEKELCIMRADTQPKILVATQVVEVSLDISYDVAYLEPAPIDALVQRMGRVNRRGDKPPASIHLMEREISARSIYKERNRVKKTIEELFELSRLGAPISENDLVEVADRIYEGGYNEEELDLFNQGLSNRELQDFENEMLAGASEDWKDQVLTDSGGIDVLPQRFLDKFDLLIKDKLFLEAYSLLVPLQWRSQIREELDFSHDPPVTAWKYSSALGLTVPSDNVWDDDLSESLPSDPSNIL